MARKKLLSYCLAKQNHAWNSHKKGVLKYGNLCYKRKQKIVSGLL